MTLTKSRNRMTSGASLTLADYPAASYSGDSGLALAAAHTALPASGGEILIPPGTYTITTNVVFTKPVVLRGLGCAEYSTVLTTPNTTGDMIRLTGWASEVRNLAFTSSVTRTSGAFVFFDGVANGLLDNFNMDSYAIGVQLHGNNGTVISNGGIANGTPAASAPGASSAILLDAPINVDCRIQSITTSATLADMPASGIRVVFADALMISDCDIIRHGICLDVSPGNGQGVAASHVVNSYFDNATYGLRIAPSGNANVPRACFSNCWFSSHTQAGIYIDNLGTGVITGLQFIGGHAISNAGSGLLCQDSADMQVIGGQYGENAGYGIAMGADVSNFIITACDIGSTGGLGANVLGGVVIAAGASDHYRIIGNDITGNTGGNLLDGGTGTDKIISNNIGHKSRATGTAALGAGLTSVAVTHGLAGTPPVSNIKLTPVADPLLSTKWWISATGATTFTITVNTAPGGAGTTFGWSASLAGD